MKTAEGAVEHSAPRTAGRDEAFRSEIRPRLKGRSRGAGGPCGGDAGPRAQRARHRGRVPQPTTARRFSPAPRSLRPESDCGRIARRSPAAISAAMTSLICSPAASPSGSARASGAGRVLAAWGMTREGRKVLPHLMSGSKEDYETVSAFFQDMRGRGLGDPPPAVCDGAPGIIKATGTCFPRSERQRCLFHRMSNLAAKVSRDEAWPGVPAGRPAPHARRLPGPSPAVLALILSGNGRRSSPARRPASRMTSRPAPRICGCRCGAARRSGPQTCWSACSAGSGGA